MRSMDSPVSRLQRLLSVARFFRWLLDFWPVTASAGIDIVLTTSQSPISACTRAMPTNLYRKTTVPWRTGTTRNQLKRFDRFQKTVAKRRQWNSTTYISKCRSTWMIWSRITRRKLQTSKRRCNRRLDDTGQCICDNVYTTCWLLLPFCPHRTWADCLLLNLSQRHPICHLICPSIQPSVR